MKIRLVLLVFAVFITGMAFSQQNRYQAFFREIDSAVQDESALSKLQEFNKRKKLSKYEKIELYKRIIPLAVNLQKYDIALNFSFQGEKVAEILKDDSLKAAYINQIGGAYYYIGKRNEAISYFKKANAIARQHGFWKMEAKTLSNLGALAIEHQEYADAERYLKKSIEIFKKHNIHHKDGLLTYRLLATLYTDTGKFKKSKLIYDELIDISRQIQDTDMMCTSMTYYAQQLSKQGFLNEAINMAETSLQFQRKLHNKTNLVNDLAFLSSHYMRNGDYQKAAKINEEIINLNSQIFQDNLKNGIVEVEVKYKTEEIRRQKELAEAKALAEQRKKNQYLFVSIGIVFLLIIVFLLVYFKQQGKRKQFEIALQKMHLEDILKAQEAEKVRIARDLHDGICQKFAATKMKFSFISKDLLDNQPEMKTNYAACVNLLDEATNELRGIAHEIMPPSLHESGLDEALKQLCMQTFTQQINHTFEALGKVEEMSETFNINLYRIAQELFANLLKHAHATEVSVQLLYSSRQIILHVEDNGIGFSAEKKAGMGLRNMHLRAEMIQAKLNIEPGANGGTLVSVIASKA